MPIWFQLADGFGWDAYRNVLGAYESDNHSNPSNLPSNNAEEKDEFFWRWSYEVGYDMHRFMVDTWGLQVSQSVINSVASLPDWMPVLAQDDYIDANIDQPVSFNVLENDMVMDGVIQIVDFTQPIHGQLADDGNGDFTYTPHVGFSGTDGFLYTVRSSAGNTVTGTVELAVFETLSVDQPVDTYIHQASPNSDRSSSNILEVDGNDSGGEVQTLLRYEYLFGPRTNQIPEHATIHSQGCNCRLSMRALPSSSIECSNPGKIRIRGTRSSTEFKRTALKRRPYPTPQRAASALVSLRSM